MNCTCVYKICRQYICGKSALLWRWLVSLVQCCKLAEEQQVLLLCWTWPPGSDGSSQEHRRPPRETRYITSTTGLICPCKVPHVKQLEAPATLFPRRIKTFCFSAETEIMTLPPVSFSHHSNISARAQIQIKRMHVLAFLFKYFNYCKTPVSHWWNVEK